jgi:hypothetical protein
VSGGLGFLLVGVFSSIVGSLVLWFRHRKPTSLESGVDAFSREMQALSPERAAQLRSREPAGRRRRLRRS